MTSNLILLINFFIQTAFLGTCPSAIYLALVIEIETVLCFSLLQDITALFQKK